MKKNIFLVAFFALFISVPAMLAQDMGQDFQGGGGRRGRRGGGDNGDDQGGGMRGMRGDMGGRNMGPMGGDMGGRNMGPMNGGMDGGMRGGGPTGGWGGGGPMGGGPMGGGMTPEAMQAMQQARMQRTQTMMLQNIDANHNGIIEPEEAQGQNAFMLDRIIRGAGIEPQYPMPVSKVQEALNNRMRGGMPGSGQASSSNDKAAEEKKASEPRLVPGFDVAASSQPPVLGFGVSDSKATADAKKTGASASTTSSTASDTSASSAPPLDDKIRSFAQVLMKKYDKNGNTKLERDLGEWAEMSSNTKLADKDNDGIITFDELSRWLAADSQSGPKSSSMASASGSGQSAGKKRIRARSATERLPEGMPDWFSRKDSDADGQVSMFEYNSGDWTQAKAKEFTQYDLNNDGIITPQEILKATKKKL